MRVNANARILSSRIGKREQQLEAFVVTARVVKMKNALSIIALPKPGPVIDAQPLPG
jgi:hypothetical protein